MHVGITQIISKNTRISVFLKRIHGFQLKNTRISIKKIHNSNYRISMGVYGTMGDGGNQSTIEAVGGPQMTWAPRLESSCRHGDMWWASMSRPGGKKDKTGSLPATIGNHCYISPGLPFCRLRAGPSSPPKTWPNHVDPLHWSPRNLPRITSKSGLIYP